MHLYARAYGTSLDSQGTLLLRRRRLDRVRSSVLANRARQDEESRTPQLKHRVVMVVVVAMAGPTMDLA